MANYFPVGYQPAQIYYPQQYQAQPPQQMTQAQQVQPQTPPIQQSGFVRVQSENEARMYPVAPGNSVTFIDENAPYCYTKTMDFSQLDRPKFDKYRLVKEEETPTAPQGDFKSEQGKDTAYALKSDVDALKHEIEALKHKADKKAKKEDEDDE